MSGSRGAFIAGFALSALIVTPSPADAQVVYMYRAHLRGNLVVPPTPSPGVGELEGSFESSFECGMVPNDRWLLFVSYRNLQGTPTGCFIHRGPSGANGERLYTVFPGWFPSPSLVTTAFDHAAHCTDLQAGNLYAVITTDLYPAGEVRDQIHPDGPVPVERSTWGMIKVLYD